MGLAPITLRSLFHQSTLMPIPRATSQNGQFLILAKKMEYRHHSFIDTERFNNVDIATLTKSCYLLSIATIQNFIPIC